MSSVERTPQDATPQPCTTPVFLPGVETVNPQGCNVPTGVPETKPRPAKKKPAEGRARKHDGWWSRYAALHVLNNSSASSWKHILAAVKQPTPQLGIEELQHSYLITDTTLSMPPNVGTPALQQQSNPQPLFRPSFSALEAPESDVPIGPAKRARRCSLPEESTSRKRRRRRSCPAATKAAAAPAVHHDAAPSSTPEETFSVRASPLPPERVPDSAETTFTANESFSVFEDEAFQLDTLSNTSLPSAPPVSGASVFALPGDETTRWGVEEPPVSQLYSDYFC